jgi:Exostosin family
MLSTIKIFVPRHADCELVTIHESPIDGFIDANQGRGVVFVEDAKRADMIVLFEEWSTKFWQYSRELTRSRLISDNLYKVFTVNNDDVGRGHLPGCYVSLTRKNFIPALHRSCCYPYVINEYVSGVACKNRSIRPNILFSFRGNANSHPIRKKIFSSLIKSEKSKIVDIATTFHHHTQKQKRDYVADVLNSKFVLCPRGASPSSYRLFEVMELGRCPVIISDDWVPISGICWQKCAILVPEADIGQVPDILTRNEHRAAELGRRARETWEINFSHSAKFRAMLEMLLQVRKTLLANPVDHVMRWGSWRFSYSNGWTIPQRAVRKVRSPLAKAIRIFASS